jgi:glycosyltransferase involved in cell wall biosynthesis
MLISVVIPTYNRSELLRKSLGSVLSQTYSDLEVIVVDDGSEEDIESVVKSFDDDRLVYIEHDVNKGGSVARNTGIEHATGDCIAFLDSDDQWIESKLEKQADLMKRSGNETGVIYCDYFDGFEFSSRLVARPHDLRDGDIHADLLSGWMNIMTSQLLVKSECFDRVGVFNPDLPSFQEYDLLTRIAKEYSAAYVDERLVVKNSGKFSQISDDHEARLEGLEMFLDLHAPDMIRKLDWDDTSRFSRSRLGQIYRSKVCEKFENGNLREGMAVVDDWTRDDANLDIVDLALVLTTLIARQRGQSMLEKLYFHYSYFRYGGVRRENIHC